MKVKDINDSIVVGVHRGKNGGLVVDDKNSYNKYINEKKQKEEIAELKDKLAAMEQLMKQLMEKLT
jgi:K+/H+ antiporter YhaU regulatory subunit KhtT